MRTEQRGYEMAYLVKCVLCKLKGLDYYLQNSHKNGYSGVHWQPHAGAGAGVAHGRQTDSGAYWPMNIRERMSSRFSKK